MSERRCLFAYHVPTRSVWKRAMEAGVSFGLDPITAELSVNYDELNISDFNKKSEMEQREKQLRLEIANQKEGLTEIMRQEKVLKDALEIIGYIRRGGIRPVRCDLLNQCLQSLESQREEFAD